MGWFFGYGSLVNHQTHDNRPLLPGVVAGWRREWCLTSLRPAAFLSVRPDPAASIAGLLAQVPGGDWSALDARERAYDRHMTPVSAASGPERAAIYQVTPDLRAATGKGHILLSYLDVVVEGYHHHFGTDGVAAFFATTDGWDRPVRDDRAAPIYPRHRDTGPDLRALTDKHLAGLSAVIHHLE